MPLIYRPEYQNVQDPEVRDMIEYFAQGKFSRATTQPEFFSLCNKQEVEAIGNEIRCLQEDFRYAAKNYFWIVTKYSEEKLFSLWPAQELILEAMEELRLAGKPQKLLVIKSRQLGCSLLMLALILWKAAFFTNKYCTIVSTDASHTEYLMRLMTGILDKLPIWLRPPIQSKTKGGGIVFGTPPGEDPLFYPPTGSEIMLSYATQKFGVGQGRRINAAHLSEFEEYIKGGDPKEIIEEDLKNALVDSPETIAVLESTAKGAGNYGDVLWGKMVELGDDAEWRPLFLPWFFEPTRVLAPTKGWHPNSDTQTMTELISSEWVRCDGKICRSFFERTHKGRDRDGDTCPKCKVGTLHAHQITRENQWWMERTRLNAQDEESRDKIKQELATTATEAFIVTGKGVFPSECIDFVDYMCREPKARGFFTDDGIFHGLDSKGACIIKSCGIDHSSDSSDIWIWELPDKKHTYYIGVDPSHGFGGDKDYAVIWVNRVDRATGYDVQVATFRSNTTDPVELAMVANRIGRWYNEAEIAVEYTGIRTTADYLKIQLQYPNLYREKHPQSVNIVGQMSAWRTDHTTKPKLITTGIRWLKAKRFIVRDKRFPYEMRKFRREDENDRWHNLSAAKSFNDDLIMGGLITLYCSHEMDFDENLGYIPIKSAATMESAAWHLTCERCNEKWPSDDRLSAHGGCPKCGYKGVAARPNEANRQGVSVDPILDIYNTDQHPDQGWDEEFYRLEREQSNDYSLL